MKITLYKPAAARSGGAERRWPGYLLNGRIRTSTVVLIIAFCAVWWVYDTYRSEPTPPVAPQVVPPGFVPDPAYTWVPRTRVQPPPTTTTEPPTTTETTEPPTSEPETSTPVPGFPFCPPLCPPPTTAEPTPPGQPPPASAGAPQPSASPEAPSPSPGARQAPAPPSPVSPSAVPPPATVHPVAP